MRNVRRRKTFAIEPHARDASSSCTGNIVDEGVADMHGLPGLAICRGQSGAKNCLVWFAASKVSAHKHLPKKWRKARGGRFCPLHSRSAIRQQIKGELRSEFFKEGQHINIGATVLETMIPVYVNGATLNVRVF